MNNNLKKVISAAAALTLSVSSFAALAANFPDVEDSASYNAAVSELSALNIISGYEDGTFKPDNLVTRAEITKMIVDARRDAATASTVGFNDSKSHWAVSYIAAGVQAGFISGYSDTEFGPDDNVTFVQAQKMLVAATGYDTFAQANGGWPGGYKVYANSLDITEGVSASDDDQLTRAQVAQMIDNAMNAPLCVIETYQKNILGGTNPVYDVKNGTGDGWQTLFTEKHKAYKVYGRVTRTYKSAPDSGLNTDEINFRVEKADNFDKKYVDPKYVSSTEIGETVYAGETNADEYLNVYAEALIQKDNNGEYTMLSIAPAAANKSVVFNATDVDDSKTNLANNVMYFYNEGSRTSTKYELADTVNVYVNNVLMNSDLATCYANYIWNSTDKKGYRATTVELQKETEIGSTSSSSKYSTIKITTYETRVVDEVIDKSAQTIINFASGDAQLKILKDDDTRTYNFTLNGEEIDPADLQQNDVLSISYDHNNNSINDSKFLDVLVSRDTVEDVRCTGVSTTSKEYTIGGTKYLLAKGVSVKIETGTTYSLYLDVFGDIAYVDESTTAKKLGILKNIYTTASGESRAVIITKEGVEEEYKVDDTNVVNYATAFAAGVYTNGKAVYASTGATSKLEAYPQQIVEYTVSASSNKITLKVVRTGKDAQGNDVDYYTYAPVAGQDFYKESNSRIGSVRISDSSVILDVSEADSDKYKVISASSLVDGTQYTVYGVDKSDNDSSYRFVVLTSGAGQLTPDSQIAIYNGEEQVEDDEETKTAYNVITTNADGENEEVQIILDSDSVKVGLNEGDAILYTMNSAGYVSKVYPIFADADVSPYNYSNMLDYNAKILKKLADGTNLFNTELTTPKTVNGNTYPNLMSDKNDEVSLYFGPVVNKNGSNFVIGKVTTSDGKYFTNYNDGQDISAAGAKVYTYNLAGNASNSRIVYDNGIQATLNASAAKDDNDTLELTHENVQDSVVYALVRAINTDEAQEVYLIVAED